MINYDIIEFLRKLHLCLFFRHLGVTRCKNQPVILNPYLFHSQKLFDKPNGVKILLLLSLLVAELNHIWYKLFKLEKFTGYWLCHLFPFIKQFIDENPSLRIVKQAYKVIDKREKIGQTNRIDLMQLLLESASKDDIIQV
jgi:hypothetical protein